MRPCSLQQSRSSQTPDRQGEVQDLFRHQPGVCAWVSKTLSPAMGFQFGWRLSCQPLGKMIGSRIVCHYSRAWFKPSGVSRLRRLYRTKSLGINHDLYSSPCLMRFLTKASHTVLLRLRPFPLRFSVVNLPGIGSRFDNWPTALLAG